MPKFLISLFTELASIIGGGVNGALGIMTSLIGKGFSMAVQFHEEGIAFAREVGLSAREAQAYTQVLTERTEKLALKYGVAAEAIREVQRGIVDATGKQYMLNEAEAERQVQINKLVGAGTANQFTEQMMNHMGAQLSTVQGAVSKAYATAAKSGLNAAKFSKEVAKNLSLANKLSFRDGVNGIIRMTALSEKLGFNLQSVEAAANKFMDLDSAIESSAQLQMLGGAAGAFGGNPLEMAYEANYDPEAFTKRMTKTLGGYASFDAKTGTANVNGMNRDFVKGIAQAMGISMDEAMSIAKKQAEIKYKENAYAPELGRIKNQEQRDFIINKSYVDTKTGQLMINDIRGKAHNISENGIDGIIKELQEFDNMSEKDIMQKQAETLISINDQIKGIGASFAASIAKYLNQYLPGATTAIKDLAKEIQPHIQEIGRNVGDFAKTVIGWAKSNKDTIKDVVKGVFGITSWLTKHWPILLGLWVGKKVLGSAIGGKTLGARAAKGGVSTIKSASHIIKSMWTMPLKLAKSSVRATKAFKGAITHGSGIKGAFSAAKTSLSRAGTLKTFGKLAKSGGVGIIGAIGGIGVDYLADNGKIKKGGKSHQALKATTTALEYGAVGAMFGPLGAGIGAAVGAVKGAYDTWKSLPENADKDFIDYAKSVGNSIVEGGKEAFSWAKEKVGPALSSVNKEIQERGGYLSVAFNLITTPIRLFINTLEGIAKFIVHPVDTIKSIWNKLTNWLSGDNVLGKLFNKTVDAIIGEKHTTGGIVGTKQKETLIKSNSYIEKHTVGGIVGGNSYSGDRILTGLNSGEMVLNKNQQAALFNFINEMPSVLSKIGSNGNVSYYSARNYSNSNITDRSLQMSYDTSNYGNSSKTENNAYNNSSTVGGNVSYYSASNYGNSSIIDRSLQMSYNTSNLVSRVLNSIANSSNAENNAYNNSSIRQKHEALYSNTVGGNVSNTFNGVQTDLFRSIGNIFNSIISPFSTLKNSNDVKAKPVGEREYIYKPNDIKINGAAEITVKDVNVNINGTIKLDAGNLTKNIDVRQLLGDSSFLSSLKDIIKESINNDMNGGRFMNDNATLRGGLANTTYWGR